MKVSLLCQIFLHPIQSQYEALVACFYRRLLIQGLMCQCTKVQFKKISWGRQGL